METPSDISEHIDASLGTSAELKISASMYKTPPITEKLSDNDHGNRFQSKLLFLFFIRAINKGYNFHLGTELFKFGGKFDDLIFIKDGTCTSDEGKINNRSYLYLQAKHRMYEKSHPKAKNISTANLLHEHKGDFSLTKYFHSYCDDVTKTKSGPQPKDKVDCIICTNIDFDEADLANNRIELVIPTVEELNALPREMLNFAKQSTVKVPTCYRIKPIPWLDLHYIANVLSDCANNRKKKLDKQDKQFKSYQAALVREKVIDLKTNKFHHDFINGNNLSEGAKKLRYVIDGMVKDGSWIKWTFNFNNISTFHNPTDVSLHKNLHDQGTENDIEDFFKKLIFAVNTPNEDELTEILKEEVGHNLNLLDTDLQSAYILGEMSNWFKREHNVWLSAEQGKKILLDKPKEKMDLLRATGISFDYQEQLKVLEFNNKAVSEMATKLEQLLAPPEKLVRISTLLPKFTAVKVIRALRTLKHYSRQDSYLVVQSKRLQNEEEFTKTKNLLKTAGNSHHLLVIVCDDDGDDSVAHHQFARLKTLIPDHKEGTGGKRKKGIFIGGSQGAKTDELNFGDLSDATQTSLLDKCVSFQGADVRVRDLVQNGKEEISIDSLSINELIKKQDTIVIPSFNTSSTFEKSLYLKREMTIPFPNDDEQLWFELAKDLNCKVEDVRRECQISTKGIIEWASDRKSIIWEAMTSVSKKHSVMSPLKISEDDLEKRRILIISGLAGSGKSTILSHHYKEIKKANSSTWVIKINLIQHSETISKFDFNSTSGSSAADFFINSLAAVFNQSAFALSLLRHRFETAGNIIVMFDGFDEISTEVQDKAIQLMEAIRLSKADRLYVTTRSHMDDKLQDKMFQFVCHLENFSKEDQISYLCNYWRKNTAGLSTESIQQFANSLVERISGALKDNERTLIGIPLQCRILAECFQSDIINGTIPTDSPNLVRLYDLFMDTKSQLFRKEKINLPDSNPIVESAINVLIKRIESYLAQLAIETLFEQKTDVITLWPDPLFQSEDDKDGEEDMLTENGLKFGLTFQEEDDTKIQFLHRTFAEYLVAKYLYHGFLLDERRHNKLLETEPVIKLIVEKVLVEDNFDGVRVFLDCMLNEIVEKDEWLTLINQRLSEKILLPERLKRFANSVYCYTKQSAGKHRFSAWQDQPFATIIRYKNDSLFTFICDCLSTLLDSAQFWEFLNETFEDYPYFLQNFFDTSSEILKRCLDYSDDADKVKTVLGFMLYDRRGRGDFIRSESMGYNGNLIMTFTNSHPNQEETRRKNLEMVFDFMDKNRTVWKQMQETNFKRGHKYLLGFFKDKNYDDLIRKCLQLFSWLYSDDVKSFFDLWNITFFDRSIRGPDDQIEKLLTTLENLDQKTVVEAMSRLVLKWFPDLFIKFYVPRLTENYQGLTPSIQTRLHLAAFHCEEETIKRLLDSAEPAQIDRDAYGFTPLYISIHMSTIATNNHHEEACRIMLRFLKEALSPNQLYEHLTNENGALNIALYDAVELGNVTMFHLILKLVQQVFGQEYAVSLLQLPIPEERVRQGWDVTSIVSLCNNQALIKIIVEIVGYHNLNVLLFRDKSTVLRLEQVDAETLEGLIAVNGCSDWIKRLLDTTVDEGFQVISQHIFKKLERHNQLEVIRTITSRSSDRIHSYWGEWLDQRSRNQEKGDFAFHDCDLFLKSVHECLGENSVKIMVLQDESKLLTRILLLSLTETIFNIAVRYLSKENQNEAVKCIINCAPELIQELFLDPEQNPRLNWTNIFQEQILDCADGHQLTRIVRVILTRHKLKGGEVSIWKEMFIGGYFYRCSKFNKSEKVYLFLKCIRNKLGEKIADELVQHDHVATCAFFRNEQFGLRFGHNLLANLSQENQEKASQSVIRNAVQSIDHIFSNSTEPFPHHIQWMNILQVIVKSADSHQLSNYVKVITFIYTSNKGNASVWSNSFEWSYYDPSTNSDPIWLDIVNKFLKCVSEKLSKNDVKELVLNNDRMIIKHAASTGKEDLLQVLLTHLNERDREEALSSLNLKK